MIQRFAPLRQLHVWVFFLVSLEQSNAESHSLQLALRLLDLRPLGAVRELDGMPTFGPLRVWGGNPSVDIGDVATLRPTGRCP
ncbi:MAG: hypothetical protein ACK52U_09205 [Synechococcaceae cyanobacterium]